MDPTSLLVTCLCAGWCGVCRDYRTTFDEVAATFAGRVDFGWMDIEDDEALVGDLDVTDFPTVLISLAGRAVFFGPITPQPGTLARLVQGAVEGDVSTSAVHPSVFALVQRIEQARSGTA